MLVVDEAGRILYFNQAVTRLLGLQPDVEGQPITDFIPELDWEKIRRLDHAGGQGVVRHEFEVHYPRPRFLRLYAAPLDGEAAGSAGVALILHDATEARQKTFEAIESERIQALTLLAASVAHEIGNPLNALHIHLQLMERELKKLKPPAASPSPGKSGSELRRAPGRRPSPTKPKPASSSPSSNNTSRSPGAKSTGSITSSPSSCRPSGRRCRSSSRPRSTTSCRRPSSCSSRSSRTAA